MLEPQRAIRAITAGFANAASSAAWSPSARWYFCNANKIAAPL
jgi:hypothetical protein